MASQDLSDPISLRLPTDVLADVERIAGATERTRSWVIVRALRRYLATEGADILAVIDARREATAGAVHDFDDTLGEIEKIIRAGKAA